MSLRSRTIEISRKKEKIVMVGLGLRWNWRLNYIEREKGQMRKCIHGDTTSVFPHYLSNAHHFHY